MLNIEQLHFFLEKLYPMKNIFKKNKKNTIFTFVFVFFLVFVLQNFSISLAQTSQEFSREEGIFLALDTEEAIGENLGKKDKQAVSDSYENGGANSAEELQRQAKEEGIATGTSSPSKGFWEVIISGILSYIFVFVGWILDIGIVLINWTLNPGLLGSDGLLNNGVVRSIWGTFRDLFNMFFILVLLFSAFATIFQVDKYSFKKIWLSVLLAVLLINFSFPIARFIIDVSNVMMFSFLNGTNGMNFSTNLLSSSSIEGVLFPGGKNFSDFAIPYEIAAIVFVFILAVTMAVLGALLMIRLFVLMFLIMASPIGFIFSVFPGMGGFSSKWWSALFNYAFFGPIMVFIMMIALKIMSGMQNLMDSTLRTAAAPVGTGAEMVNYLASATFIFVPVVILWIGMGVAKNMGIVGADAIVSRGKNISKWIGSRPWKLTKFGAHKFERDVLAKRMGGIFSPKAFKDAWKARSNEADRKSFPPAQGGWHDRFNKILSLGKEKTNYRSAALQSSIVTKQKELADVNQESDYLMSEYKNAMSRKDNQKMAAVLRIMFNNNDQNEFMKLQDDSREVEPFAMRDLIYEQLTESGMSENDAAKQLSDYSEIAVSKGNLANYGMAHLNLKTGKFKKTEKNKDGKNEDQIKAVMSKAVNIKVQTKADLWHWNSFLIENQKVKDKDGNITVEKLGDLHEVGKAQLLNMTKAEIGVLNRARPDFLLNLNKKYDEVMKYAEEVKETNKNQAAIIESFAKKIRTLVDENENEKENENKKRKRK